MTLRLFAMLFLSLILAACGGPAFMDKTKIDSSVLRGSAVRRYEKLYGRTVYIAKNFSFDITTPSLFRKFGLCSGVVLHDRYILTAAHCANNLEEARVIFSEDANMPLLADQIYAIQDFKVPPEYLEERAAEHEKNIAPGPTNRSNRYDLAILKLVHPITSAKYSKTYFQDLASSLYMSQNKNSKMTASALVAGYGRISEYNQIQDDPNYKKENLLHSPPPLNGILMQARIDLNIADFSKWIIQYSQRLSSGVCGGDSGAPLFVDRNGELYLQAIATATFKVKDEDPENKFNNCYGESLFLNLDFHKKWIYDTMIELEKRKSLLPTPKTI